MQYLIPAGRVRFSPARGPARQVLPNRERFSRQLKTFCAITATVRYDKGVRKMDRRVSLKALPVITLFPLFLILFSISCGGNAKTPGAVARPVGEPITIQPPLGLPAVPIPADNPPTADTVALGRRLYYDTQLSADNTIACANCHNPALAFTDGRPVSLGVNGKAGTRNAPTVLNAAYNTLQFWDGRAASLEDQAGGPIQNPLEMNQPHEVMVAKIGKLAEYQAAFDKAFGPGPITVDKVEKAIASFERTLISGNSPFDRYQYGGDKTAMSESAKRGLAIFRDKQKGKCAVCHTIEDKYALFTDGKFHNIGEGLDANGDLKDLGRYEQTKVDADRGAFRTPTLRNIAKTAPYMHDGHVKTLKDVVDFYVGGGTSNPYLDKEIKELKLNGTERADLVAFLEALSGDMPANSGPPSR
jgi:cytochrome c peroxidase